MAVPSTRLYKPCVSTKIRISTYLPHCTAHLRDKFLKQRTSLGKNARLCHNRSNLHAYIHRCFESFTEVNITILAMADVFVKLLAAPDRMLYSRKIDPLHIAVVEFIRA